MADGPIPHLAHHMEEKENKRKVAATRKTGGSVNG